MMWRKKERKTFQIELSVYFTGSKDDDDVDYFDGQPARVKRNCFNAVSLEFCMGVFRMVRCGAGG